MVFPEERFFAELQRAHGLLERCFKSAIDRHHFPCGFHLCAQQTVAAGEFIERPARDLYYNVIERRFKSCHRFTGDGIGNFVQPFTHGDF